MTCPTVGSSIAPRCADLINRLRVCTVHTTAPESERYPTHPCTVSPQSSQPARPPELNISPPDGDNSPRPSGSENPTRRNTSLSRRLRLCELSNVFNLAPEANVPPDCLSVLSLGFKFLPRYFPKPEARLEDAVNGLNGFLRRVRLALHFGIDSGGKRDPLHVKSNWTPPDHPQTPLVDNYSECCLARLHAAWEALPSAKPSSLDLAISEPLRALRRRTDILVCSADKNLGPVVTTPRHYDSLACACLTPDSYCVTDRFHRARLFSELRSILFHHGYLYQPGSNKTLSREAKYILQQESDSTCSGLGHFYLLIKMHKKVPAGRPIVASYNAVSYYASKYVDRILQPLRGFIPSMCTSAAHLLTRLPKDPLPPGAVFLVADVKSLYPSIPILFGMDAAVSSINRLCMHGGYDLSDLQQRLTQRLLHWVLCNNYFTYDNKTFLQTKGTAMGTPVAVTYADLVLAHMEHLITLRLATPPLFYTRYIDDLFGIFPSVEAANEFVSAFNSIEPCIQLDLPEIGDTANFLDLHLSVAQDGHITSTVFQKAMNRYLYLSPFSAHQRNVLANLITAERRRYRLYCSDNSQYREMCLKLFHRLRRRGHNSDLLVKLFNISIPSRADLLQRSHSVKEYGTSGSSANLPLVDRSPNRASRLHWRDILLPRTGEPVLQSTTLTSLLCQENVIIVHRHYPNMGSLFSPKHYPRPLGERYSTRPPSGRIPHQSQPVT